MTKLDPHVLSAGVLSLVMAGTVAHAAETGTRKPTEVEEVVVTAAPYAVSLDTITTSVTILSAETLSLAPPAGLGDLLAGLPGLRSTAYGPGASRPVVTSTAMIRPPSVAKMMRGAVSASPGQ